ncbi:hypothetical protein C5C03_00180 [Clavibacter michiganensis]|uniref:hypothetical protein n=1 Tax=Clavibacter michiganensis TaxID=28447 RepID=UPI000CE92009|nr:hypothetical protein [Clavibacter michiganensis]PPF91279.1 hypothetical protein C5C03_00180 [Clavibacter michiganensis]PPF99321.1 hypothetical protein C5C05_01985 [Clavibacter michiganensis]
MSSITPSTRPPRRLSRAVSIAATAAIALSAIVGFGVAPASANAPLNPKVTIAVHTHFSSGWNVQAIRVTGSTIIRNGKKQPKFDYCYSMGTPGRDGNANITIHLPSGDLYQVISYADNACQASFAPLGGGSSLVTTDWHDWTVFARRGLEVQ